MRKILSFVFVLFLPINIGNSADNTKDQMLIDLVTQTINASDLNDSELCQTLRHIDLVSTYQEMRKRNLNCLSIDKVENEYKKFSKEKAFKFLESYKQKHKVLIPSFSLSDDINVFGNVKSTAEILSALNPNFTKTMPENKKYADFCLDWFPKVATLVENQSKNLDGSVSWSENTLRDGFAICQDHFNQVIYAALHDSNLKNKIKLAIENWIMNDTPHRESSFWRAEGTVSASVTYPLLLNKILMSIELLHNGFNWSAEEYNNARKWVIARAIEVVPGAERQKWADLAEKCITDIKSQEDKIEVCANVGILQAQVLLRAGIFAKDRELVEKSFIAFHRYMSAIRNDGSNAPDSTRGCTAAGYNIWASQFMTDYIYLWSLIGGSLWDHRSFGRGSPKEAVEYSLSLFGDFEKINKYTLPDSWDGCGSDKLKKTQYANTRRQGQYSKVSFAPYYQVFKRAELVDILINHYDRTDAWSYTRQSGIANEGSILFLDNDLKKNVLPALKQRQAEQEQRQRQAEQEQRQRQAEQEQRQAEQEQRQAEQEQRQAEQEQKFALIRKEIDSKKNKEKDNFKNALDNHGLLFSDNRNWSLRNNNSRNLLRSDFYETIEPSKPGSSKKHRFRLEIENDSQSIIFKGKMTLFEGKYGYKIGVNLEKIFNLDTKLDADYWKSLLEECDIFDEKDPFYIDVPIAIEDRKLNNGLKCLVQNNSDENIKSLIQTMVFAGNSIFANFR